MSNELISGKLHMRFQRVTFLFCAFVLTVAASAQAPFASYVDVAIVQAGNADTVAAALAKKGLIAKRVRDEQVGRIHLRVGPYATAEAAKLRAKLVTEGYPNALLVEAKAEDTSQVSAPSPNDAAAERMRSMEAEANAKLFGTSAPSASPASNDLEAQALAKLGLALSPKGPQTPADREAEALRAMQANTAQAEIDAENRRQAQLIADQQAEAARLQREINQANAPQVQQQSTAAMILNGISGAISQATAQAQDQNAIQNAANQQVAQLRSLQQQIAARQAAEQARQQAVAAQARQQAAAQQARQSANESLERPAAAQQTIAAQPQEGISGVPSNSAATAGRCPNGNYRGGMYAGHPCDCRSSSAAYNCPSSPNPSGSSGVKQETQFGGGNGVSRPSNESTPRTTVASAPVVVATESAPVFIANPKPSYSTRDSQGNVTLGTGSPRACAVSNSGSQLPLTPGTTAGTCNPASCRNLLYMVSLKSRWTDAKKTEVIGFFDNDSLGDATCTWAFHKHGVWTDEGQIYVKFGEKHKGGESGGVWATGTDSSDIKYACFEGIDPVDVHGNICNQNIVFSGPTEAGTDK